MEYLLIVAFAIGLLLFLLSWLRVIIAGFAHHFLTGIVAILPVVNVLVLPSVWHQVYAWVMAGFLGFLLAVATWFAGADKQVYQYAHQAGFELPTQQLSHPVAASNLSTDQATVEVKIPAATNTVTATKTANDDPSQPAHPLPTGKELPKTALFTMTYKAVDTQQLGEYQGQYVRLTQKDRQHYEGKLLGTEAGALRIERRVNGGLVEHKVSFADIVSTEVMTRE